jgi:hypothetical protein
MNTAEIAVKVFTKDKNTEIFKYYIDEEWLKTSDREEINITIRKALSKEMIEYELQQFKNQAYMKTTIQFSPFTILSTLKSCNMAVSITIPSFTVSGHNYNEFNAPVASVRVQAFDKDHRSELLWSNTNSDTLGQYNITFLL